MEIKATMLFSEISAQQARVQIDANQVYGALVEAKQSMRSYLGGMTWKPVGGRDYLIRITNRHGGSKSLGPRNEKTEEIYREFVDAKKRLSDRIASLHVALSEQGAMARALGLGRVPVIAANVLRAIEDAGLTRRNLLVIGTHAMYAYESAGGVRFSSDLMATQDIDLLWDTRSRLQLAELDDSGDVGGVLSLLKSVDKSFEPVKNAPYRAENKDGFYVDLVKNIPNPPWLPGVPGKIADGDLDPSGIDQLKWLLSSEKFKATVIDQRGNPANMTCPDPRAFAIYKNWMSQLPERDPLKRRRDFAQGQACAQLVVDQFQHLPFDDDELRMFPHLIIECAKASFGIPRG